MSLAVVTVLHNSARDLPALLDSVARWLPGAQVIAVDSGSSDDGAAVARDRGAEVIELEGNPGYGAANNAGVAAVRREHTVLLNPDCELLGAGVATLPLGGHDALFAPRLVGTDGHQERSAHPLPGTVGALLPALVHPPLLPRALRERAEPWRSTSARTAGWAVGACLAARTATLRRLGPFDPEVFLFYEDMDLCLAARAAGVPTVFVPGVTVRHAGARSTAPAFGGEPLALNARRRRETVRARRGAGALVLDDAAQALTFATRIAGRAVAGREHARERAQLRTLARCWFA